MTTPAQQHARYRQAKTNPASTPDTQLARRLLWQREQDRKRIAGIREQFRAQRQARR